MNAAVMLSHLDSAGFSLLRLLLTVLWQSTILLAACGGLAFLLRKRRESVRHALWVGALLLLPLLPVLSWTVSSLGAPQREIPMLPEYAEPVQPASDGTGMGNMRPMGEADHLPESPAKEIPKAPLRFSPWAVGLVLYAGMVLFFLSAIFAGRLRVRRWIREGEAVTSDRVLALFGHTRERLGLPREVTLLESEGASVPFTFHTLHPVVVLPRGFAERLSEAEMISVFAHELAHVRRRDPLVLTLVSLVRALFFFQPLVWLATRETEYLAECACDAAALELTGEARAYAGLIFRLAEDLPKKAISSEYAAGLVFSKSVFLKRVEAILSGRRMHMKRLTGSALAGTLFVALFSLVLALACGPGNGTGSKTKKPEKSGNTTSITPADSTGILRVVKKQATVSGKVKGYDGKPVRGAKIYLLVKRNSGFPGATLFIMPPTAKSGVFSFRLSEETLRDPGMVKELIVYSPKYAITFRHLQNVAIQYDPKSDSWRDIPTGPDMKNVQVTMGRPARISAILRDTAGRPVKDGLLMVTSIGRGGNWNGFDTSVQLADLTGKSDATGKAVIYGLPEGAILSVWASAQGYAYEARRDAVQSGAENISFTLLPEGRIEGRVTAADTGKPVEGVRVHARGPDDWFPGGRDATTDRNGRYSIGKTRPGTYSLMVSEWPRMTGKLSEYAAAQVDSIRIGEGQIRGNTNIRLVRGGIITGRVAMGDTGKPVQGKFVMLYGKGGGFTSDIGVFQFRAAPGSGYVYIFAPPIEGYTPTPARFPVTVKEGKTVSGVDFIYRKTAALADSLVSPVSIFGKVTYTDTGKPAEGIGMRITNPKVRMVGKRTDRDGAYSLSGVLPGTYEMVFYSIAERGGNALPEYAPLTLKNIVVTAGKTPLRVDARLQRVNN